MAVTAADVINVALPEVGYHEGRSPDGSWNNDQKYSDEVPGLEWSDWQAWCATFVSWCAMRAGAADLYPRTASCYTGVQWFKARGRFSEYPAVGAQVFFGSGGGTHTGLVVDYDETYIYTVEGNTNTNGSAQGDGVYRQKRARRDAYVYGYGYPKFEGGIRSADPAYGAQKPAEPKPEPKPVVSVAHINAARAKDIPAATGHTTYPAEVKLVEAALVAEGFLSKTWADGSWGTKTDEAFNAFRRSIGLTGDDARGSVGSYSLGRLGAKRGFEVKA